MASPIVAPDTTTTYLVEVTDSLGVVSQDSVKVIVDSTCCVSHASFTGDSVICYGDSVEFQNNSLVNGANPTYEWDFGPEATPSSYSGSAPPKIWFDTSGTHPIKLILTDSCGTDTATGTLSILPLPVAEAGEDTTACIEDSVRLGDVALAWHRYDWTPSKGLSDTSIADPKALVDTPITYYVKATNSQTGCSRTDTVSIDTLSRPTPLDLGNDSTLCQGDSVLLAASGYPVVDHQCQNGSTDSSVWADTTGSYRVKDSNKCGTNRDTVDLVFDLPPSPDLGPDTSICYHDSLLLDASHSNGSYLWQNGSTDSTLWADTADTYWVKLSDPYCPTVTDTIRLDTIPSPSVELGKDTTICYPDTVHLDASFPNASYQWHDGSSDPTYPADTTGLYWVQISNVCGSESDSISITSDPARCPISVLTPRSAQGSP